MDQWPLWNRVLFGKKGIIQGNTKMMEITRINRSTIYNEFNENHPYYLETIAITENDHTTRYIVILDYDEDDKVKHINDIKRVFPTEFQKGPFEIARHYIDQMNYEQKTYQFGEIKQ